MKKKLTHFFPLILLILPSCAALNSSPKEEKHQLELTLTKLRSDIEELRTELNSSEMKQHILEGKITNQESQLSSIRQNQLEPQKAEIEQLSTDLNTVEKQLSGQIKKQEEAISDIRQLTLHANETTSALTQYKEKIADLERSLAEVSKIKANIKELSNIALNGLPKTSGTKAVVYEVQEGDTLERIARRFGTSAPEIMDQNRLKDDRILVGQKLTITLPW
ncbi:MAG: LysM peptidoglycan-binding domain-containing protein [Candidatus Algichlamydia australiensis]|nr:LysM peptidoglycan-binding domain-containing protein [Chlamydiales bacterium]